MSIQFVEALELLHHRCVDMAALVQGTVEQVTEAVIQCRPELVQGVRDNEEQIDAEEVKIERAAIDMLSEHQPTASDIRTVFAIVKINSDLERIGDCAYNIAQMVPSFSTNAAKIPHELKTMAESTLKQIDDTTKCLGLSDSALAAAVCRGDDVIDALYHQIYQDLQAGMVADTQNVPADLAMIMIAKNLERIADHCTNIAEEVVFLVRGQIIRHEH
ncbi:MAG: phosphate signaling complex protein PhoU [Planctomycetes bacterium]|nr:phosphate signaling complex protein PhoU [Planctomycetota bacterium]MDA8378667.1 phosphate signaling complex protein PhoU [Planctomycetia bacterium]